MLSESERNDILEEIRRAHDRRSASVDALKVVQAHRGYVPDEALADVAELLGMTPTELDSVATFYSLIYRRPVGRHVIKVCDSISCWVMEGEALLLELEKRLGIKAGQTTADGRFTLIPIACLGDCDHAPALMVDDDLHHDLTLEKIDGILAGYT